MDMATPRGWSQRWSQRPSERASQVPAPIDEEEGEATPYNRLPATSERPEEEDEPLVAPRGRLTGQERFCT